ncbi:MAG: MBL fold metallo-hydrolase [Gemmatimonadaceae bacterium]
MRMWVLGSGSRGNAVLFEAEGSRVLIDAGFTVRDLEARLGAVGVPGESIEDLVVTHEHTDHVRGACAAARRWGWTIHASAGTLAACPELVAAGAIAIPPDGVLMLDTICLDAVPVPHDAVEPIAIVATARGSGVRAAVVYDLGHVGEALRRKLADLDLLVLEANHDDGMLRAGPYPPSVVHRIGGRLGHLSNRAAAGLARGCAHRALSHIVLAHLSDRCNQPGLAAAAVGAALAITPFRGGLHASAQEIPIGPFRALALRETRAAQLSLGL